MKQKLLTVIMFIVLGGIITIFVVQPFENSDLDAWRNEVSFSQYDTAVSLLQDSLDNPRNTYYDFLENATIDYTLLSHPTT